MIKGTAGDKIGRPRRDTAERDKKVQGKLLSRGGEGEKTISNDSERISDGPLARKYLSTENDNLAVRKLLEARKAQSQRDREIHNL